MTERNFTKSQNEWVGIVTNVFDTDMEGRCQVRIHGQHDDTTNIPDTDLPWAKPYSPIHSAGHNKIGYSPVGIIVGSVIHGFYHDLDMQVPVYVGTYTKAGDYPQNSSNTTTDGQPQLVSGTNSSPLGGRIKNNAFITRRGKDITQDDKTGSKGPQEQNDSDGVDIVAEAKANTKFGTLPTVASLSNPIGSILQQILQVDPKNLNAVLPQALQAYQKMKDISALSTVSGITGVLGQALGAAMNAVGVLGSLSAMAQAFTPGSLSSIAQGALSGAVQALGSGADIVSTLSSTVQGVVGQSLPDLTSSLGQMVSGGTMTAGGFNDLMDLHFGQIQSNGAQATIGASPANILNQIESLIPQVAGALNSTLNIHLPNSVLNQGVVEAALQAFSLGQAFLKAPAQGKKALAIQAVTGLASQALSSIPGIPPQISSAISSVL